ncbi:1-deoxy-D-xylulose-5-phosphate reductoisomerase [Candidatus Profftia tarda]|nr:1-deoxy-D-xylulose-5-phosphate reductoisomerase [Candidatus Profftia tarda]
MKQLTILGSTGSIGLSALAVIRANPHDFKVVALVANKNIDAMFQQCMEFMPRYASMADEKAGHDLRLLLNNAGLFDIEVTSGAQDACIFAALDNVDQVISAIVGVAGLMPTMAAIKTNKQVLLANKEALVSCGRLFMDALHQSKAQLLPIDSEHNAIFRILPESIQHNLGFAALSANGVSRIILTASGGPFRHLPIEDLKKVTAEKACKHPNWSMGPKISVDSATMMNKGLEYIEARWLFNADDSEIQVVIHPQSLMHAMVCYSDGSVIAQLASPDMRLPIAYAMAYPDSIKTDIKPLDFCAMSALTFEEPDMKRYPCLRLAIDAYRAGQAATTVLNAANEISVNAFLSSKICFTDIAALNEDVLLASSFSEPKNLREVFEIDRKAREIACRLCIKFYM